MKWCPLFNNSKYPEWEMSTNYFIFFNISWGLLLELELFPPYVFLLFKLDPIFLRLSIFLLFYLNDSFYCEFYLFFELPARRAIALRCFYFYYYVNVLRFMSMFIVVLFWAERTDELLLRTGLVLRKFCCWDIWWEDTTGRLGGLY